MSMAAPAAADAPPDVAGRRFSSSAWFWVLLVLVACGWFLTLDVRHLVSSDEGRYAEIAREMVASGDWVTIRYHGLKYFEKPPLHLWMTALAYHAFGVGEWQARLWVALSGAIGLAMTAWAARRWYGPRVGMLTALVLLAVPTWNLGGHFNSLDMGVSAALACVLAAVLVAQHPQASARSRRSWMLAAWAAMGVAVLTKGLIGIVLPGLVLVVYTLLVRDWALWSRLHIVAGTALMLAITAPWFVLVSIRNPEFAQFFFIHEHWQRYTSSVHRRTGALWYFVPQLLLGFLPWIGLAPRLVAQVQRPANADGFRPTVLLAVWAGAIFVFFSLSSSKLPGYIIPVFPALAVLAALALERIEPRHWNRQVLAMAALALAGLLASPLVGRLKLGTPENAQYRDYAVWAAAACAVAVAGMLVAHRLNRRGSLMASITAYALSMFGAFTIGLLGHESLGLPRSGVALVPQIRAVLTPDMPVYSVRVLDHTLPFYLQRTMTMVEHPDELAFGVAQEPQKWLPTLAAFRAAWTDGPHAVAVMSPDTHAMLQAEGLPMVPLAQDARRVVVTNFNRAAP